MKITQYNWGYYQIFFWDWMWKHKRGKHYYYREGKRIDINCGNHKTFRIGFMPLVKLHMWYKDYKWKKFKKIWKIS